MKIECTYCGNDLNSEELENPRKDEHDDVICDECYDDKHMNICELCEDYYEKPETPEETFFVVSKEASEELDIKPGFYQVLSYPYLFGDIVFGVSSVFENSVKLIKKANINSMLRKMYGKNVGEIGATEICDSCFNKYTSSKYEVRTNYCDQFQKVHRNIYERGIIKQGF